MSRSNKLVFFGSERLATGLDSVETLTLKSLIQHGYQITAVVSHYSQGQSRNPRPLEIAQTAQKNNIPLLLPEKLGDIKDQLENFGAVAGVLVAYGKIIPTGVIDIFPSGIINIHPSLLPKYRGPTPIEQAILDGAKQTGVSIMRLSPKMDDGPVFAQVKIALSGNESKQQLSQKLLTLGAKLLLENLPAILDGSAQPWAQDESKASYTSLLKKEDGHIDWDEPAQLIERKVRTYLGWPKSRAEIFGHNVTITKARVAKSKDDGDLVMKCHPGWLEIQQITAPSGRTISGIEFLRGYAPKS